MDAQELPGDDTATRSVCSTRSPADGEQGLVQRDPPAATGPAYAGEESLTMTRVLLLAYGCEPNRGSEAGIGWHWASQLSREHDVFLITHPRGRRGIQRELAANPRLRLRIRYVDLPAPVDPWRMIPGELLIQPRYILWQFAAYRAARKIVEREEIDLVHHVSWTTMTGPTLGWALGPPFVWGPVGSGQQAPLQMRRFLGGKGWLRELVRNQQVRFVGLNPLAVMAARRSEVAIASNPDTLVKLRELGADPVVLQPDAAVNTSWLASGPRPARYPERPIILWSSRMMARKAPGLAIEAFARLRQVRDAELWILGDGPLMHDCRKLAVELGVQADVRFWGWQPHDVVPGLLNEADIFLFTSLRDTCPMPVLEAMATGLSVVALDLHGIRYLPDEAVLKVPVGDPDDLVGDVAAGLLQLADLPQERAERGKAAWECIRDGHLWTHRYEGVQEVYASILGEAPGQNDWDEAGGRAAD
ncbi:MAG: glycosyltransferase family 4 protein [Geminicoccales bacterium]